MTIATESTAISVRLPQRVVELYAAAKTERGRNGIVRRLDCQTLVQQSLDESLEQTRANEEYSRSNNQW